MLNISVFFTDRKKTRKKRKMKLYWLMRITILDFRLRYDIRKSIDFPIRFSILVQKFGQIECVGLGGGSSDFD